MPHGFFVSGGTVGVENVVKAAMDWKVRRNFRKGSATEKGHQVIHFQSAFHGRSGYTLSMTNTADPRKYQYYAKFDWPRIVNPALRFPTTADELARVERVEQEATSAIKAAFHDRGDDIAAII